MALLNFRDVADIAGGPLRPRRLFRSAQPYQLTADEASLVHSSGVRTVIDLRGPAEVVPPDWEPVQLLGIGVIRVPLADYPAEQGERPTFGPRPEDGHRLLAGFYPVLLERAIGRVSEVVRAVGSGEPVLVHCAAGKDRTGISVAVLLDLIGTDHEAIVADYLRTQDAVPAILAQLAEVRSMLGLTDGTIPPGLGDAPEVAIRAVLAALNAAGGARSLLSARLPEHELDRAVEALTG